MSGYSFFKTYKRKLLQRGDAWACHYCGVKFIPDNTLNGTLPFYSDVPRPHYFILRGSEIVPYYDPAPGYSDQPTIDHVIPRANGGKNALNNLVFACRDCNSRKHTKDAETFNPLVNGYTMGGAK